MTREQELVIGLELFTALNAFHDCNDKEKMKRYTKEYTLKFCEENTLDPLEVLDKLNKLFSFYKKNSTYKYENFQGNKLNKIILSKKSTSTKKITEQNKELE